MRLSTANLYDASIANLQRRQQALAEQQQQLTSGKRIASASDDPTGAAPNGRSPPSAAWKPTSARWKPAATA